VQADAGAEEGLGGEDLVDVEGVVCRGVRYPWHGFRLAWRGVEWYRKPTPHIRMSACDERRLELRIMMWKAGRRGLALVKVDC
jgi:hypothetical protein